MMFALSKTTMITADQALPGRDTPMEVSPLHVVLGTPIQGPWPDGMKVLYVGMGCFWGSERIFWQLDGVYSTAVGYMGGWTRNPSYEETCTAMTGHFEAVQVVYDPAKVSLDALFAAFWENHDPTTPNRQGGDIGTQYRSAILATDQEQLDAALASKARYQARLDGEGYGPISTQIELASTAGDGRFYYAEEYHQGYLHKNPGGYCNHGFCQVSFA
ncbi:peptide-methionine (S)-S-oxide reductase MsrA [Demequina capsici]|uniref:Peptide methionine sulfoxide reductase MsrA n=1 Tax=Demequina capsici TaxID=3075620 RepID=A0AA96FG91_9MICO|nr:peptide-methionine (S)-S-oxide reductase MsrA [Demequina sp. PMTSA13]WNM27965.1 peptide-methionine (S)-S-oxide reductase MsrA [Demequina sp. PMTSA13]